MTERIPDHIIFPILDEIDAGKISIQGAQIKYGYDRNMLSRRIRERKAVPYHAMPYNKSPPGKARLLFIDVETIPNMGLFFDTFSEKSIPLEFIIKPKAICTIAWKFSDETEATVICAHEPYNDKGILEQILPIFEKADYVVWHFGEGFDRKFIEGRLWINGLPPLPPRASIDTYKLAKNKFGKTLNSNRLDHLAMLLGVGRKNKTDASLWVKCANGDLDAMREMAEYNKQDIVLLEAVYNELCGNIKSKINQNLFYDDAINRCNTCGSENLEQKGYELTANNLKHTWQCKDCGNWTPTAKKKQ